MNKIKHLLKSDYSLSVVSKIIIIFIGLLSSSFFTRYLGLTYKGDYAYISQVVNVSVLIMNLGIYQSYSFYYREYGDSVFKKYIIIFVVQFVCYSFACAVIYSVHPGKLLGCIMLLVPIQVFKVQMDNIMLVQKVRFRLLINVISAFALMIIYLVFYICLESNIMPVVIATMMVDVCVIVAYFGGTNSFPRLADFDFLFMIKVIRFGYLPMLSALLVTLNYSVDIFFLKVLGTSDELGLYSVSAGIMNYIWLIPDAFKDILFSRVAREKKQSSVPLVTKVSLYIILLSTFCFMAVGKLFIRVMYGAEFVPSYELTLVLFLGVYSMIFFKMLGVVFLAEGRRKVHFFVLLTSVLLNVFLNICLIPKYGMYGAAIASVGSYNLCGLLFLGIYCKMKRVTVREMLVISAEDIHVLRKFINFS